MKRATKIVAIVCIFSTLLMGCYTSVMIDPKGDEKVRVYSADIEAVVTKDGRGHIFDTPAKADSTSIFGMVNGKQVSIPLSDVEKVQVSSISSTTILLSVFGGLVFLGLIIGLASSGFNLSLPSTMM